MDKQEELSKMYALRAGLSIISMNYDKITNDFKLLKSMEQDYANLDLDEHRRIKSIQIEEEFQKQLANLSDIQADFKKAISQIYNYAREHSKRFIGGYGLVNEKIGDLALNFGVDTAGMVMELACYVLGNVIATPFIVLINLVALPFTVFAPSRIKARKIKRLIKKDRCFKNIVDKKEYGTSGIGNFIEKAFSFLENSGYKLKPLDKMQLKIKSTRYRMLCPTTINYFYELGERGLYEAREEGYIELEKELNDLANKKSVAKINCKDKSQEHDNLKLMLGKESSFIEEALRQETKGFLDVRDWENLDLLIYYYETGRAETIKEALQLVDNERRNNELINCMNMASKEICATIERDIRSLGKTILAGFDSLSNQLEAQRRQLASMNKAVEKNLSGLAQSVTDASDAVVTQQVLNNALLAKANVSSKEMVEQMKQLNRKIKSA